MTEIIAIDPGPLKSAVVRYDPATREVTPIGILGNDAVIKYLGDRRGIDLRREGPPCHLAVEMVACYGMPVGAEVFDTCVWIGRFLERWSGLQTRVYRRDVKLHLCGDVRAKDANVRQALLDRFGPGRQRAVGTKKRPGPLYGLKRDLWAALGVAVTLADALELHSPRGLDCVGRSRAPGAGRREVGT